MSDFDISQTCCKVAVVVLHFGSHDDTLECLRSLQRVESPDFDVFIVDNGGGEPFTLPPSFSREGISIIASGDGAGFAKGNNLALEIARERGYEYSLLLNNDTIVAPDFLSILGGQMDADPRIALAGPKTFYYDRPRTVWACGGYVRWRGAAAGGIRETISADAVVFDVGYLPGSCVLIRNSILGAIGLLPEKYFLGYEEVEFAIRAKRRGNRVVACPQAHIWHKVGMSSDPSPKYVYNDFRNRMLFIEFLTRDRLGMSSVYLFIRFFLFRRKHRFAALRAFRDHQRYETIERAHLEAFAADYERRPPPRRAPRS